jgi:hypothetical protein
MAADKDTIYIDIDDEITTVIDKLQASSSKVVALVLPKRAAVFQSIVNMKLLKRAADQSKKNLVLITTEAGLLPLAGVAGVHVARSLTSKPEIPVAPEDDDGHEEEVEEAPESGADEPLTGNEAVGDLAGLPAAAAAADEVETLELDNADEDEAADGTPDSPKERDFTPPAKAKDSKLHVPNFERFRTLLIVVGALLVLLIIGIVVAATALPKAKVVIHTDASKVNVSLALNLSTTAKELDKTSGTIPAKLVQVQKTYTQEVATTGQVNQGDKATGTVTLDDCVAGLGNPKTVPAGTGVTSGGQTYITQEDTTFDNHHGTPSGTCIDYPATSATHIKAQAAGESYNGPLASVKVSGRSDVSGSGSASGGTDNVIQTVNQSDITNAQNKINTTDPTVSQNLQEQLKQSNYYPLVTTFAAGTPTVTSSAKVGEAASTVTVTETVVDTMFGVLQNDLKALIDNNVSGQIDTSKQHILSEGLTKASFVVDSLTATGGQVAMTTTAEVGPELNVDQIKANILGLKAGDVRSQLSGNPDVTGVDVHFSPFWVSRVPHKLDRVTVVVAEPSKTTGSH